MSVNTLVSNFSCRVRTDTVARTTLLLQTVGQSLAGTEVDEVGIVTELLVSKIVVGGMNKDHTNVAEFA